MSEYIIKDDYGLIAKWKDRPQEVVRCRDCKHLYTPPWDEFLAAQYGAPPIVCERTGDVDDISPEGFCAWGVRA